MIFIYAFLAYLLLVWVGLRLIVPHFGFSKQPLPQNIPDDFQAIIEKINAESKNNLELLTNAYRYVTTRYHGGRLRTITNFWKAFQDPISQTPGFMPCNMSNYLLRLMLVKSGRFQDSDISERTVPFNLFIHQYLSIKVDGRSIDVDPWSAFLGVPLGKKSSYFG